MESKLMKMGLVCCWALLSSDYKCCSYSIIRKWKKKKEKRKI